MTDHRSSEFVVKLYFSPLNPCRGECIVDKNSPKNDYHSSVISSSVRTIPKHMNMTWKWFSVSAWHNSVTKIMVTTGGLPRHVADSEVWVVVGLGSWNSLEFSRNMRFHFFVLQILVVIWPLCKSFSELFRVSVFKNFNLSICHLYSVGKYTFEDFNCIPLQNNNHRMVTDSHCYQKPFNHALTLNI